MIAIKLAIREFKNNPRYWFFLALNLIVGLLGFTLIFLFRETVSQSLEQRSTQLLTSDIAISGRRALAEREREQVLQLLQGKYSDTTELTELYSMAKGIESGKSRLIFVKFIEGLYPLRGQIKLKETGVADREKIRELNHSKKVWVSPEVAHQFKLSRGSQMKIGQALFTVAGQIESDSTTSMRGFSLAPKVYLGRQQLESTGLMSYGTVAWSSLFFNLTPQADRPSLKKKLEGLVTDPAISVKTPKDSSAQFGRIIGYLSDFLGLVGVVALLMSAVGISYLYQSYIFDRLKQVGILKTLGMSRFHIFSAFVMQIFMLGLLGSVLTLILAYYCLPWGIDYLKEFFVGDFSTALSWQLTLFIFSLALIVNLLTCLPILINLFREPTINLLNQELQKKIPLFWYLPAVLFLWGLSIWQAHSFVIGSVFFLALFVVTLLVGYSLPWGLRRINIGLQGKNLHQPLGVAYGMGLRFLVRNQTTTLLTILSLTIGCTLISVIGQLDSSLQAELSNPNAPKPSLFLFDIQQEQVDKLNRFAKNKNIPLQNPSPMVRARLLKKNGKVVKRQEKKEGFITREQEQKRRFNNRGVNLSYAAKLNTSEEIVEGREFSGVYSGEGVAEVSLEKRYARRIGVSVGDKLTYEVLGIEVQAVVVNLRKVKWTSFLPNFFILFQPGVLEDAPKTFLAVVDQVNLSRQLEIQDQMVENFSNISILNVTEVIEKILVLFKAMAWAIGVMSLCCLLVGVFVLFSILQSQLHKKQKELAMQKIMGMKPRDVLKTVLVEYSLICFVAQLIGSAMGALVSLLVSQIFLDGVYLFNWSFFFLFNIFLYLTVILTIVMTYQFHYQKNIKHLLHT